MMMASLDDRRSHNASDAFTYIRRAHYHSYTHYVCLYVAISCYKWLRAIPKHP
jgi:hypothetical protein